MNEAGISYCHYGLKRAFSFTSDRRTLRRRRTLRKRSRTLRQHPVHRMFHASAADLEGIYYVTGRCRISGRNSLKMLKAAVTVSEIPAFFDIFPIPL
jgi:hypothetical protein